MPKSLEEMLKESGQTEDQIKAIVTTLGPAKTVFETALASAETANADAAKKLQEATDKEKRLNDWWTGEATPEINKSLSDLATAQAQAAFYRKQNEEARKSGFIAADAPGYETPATPPTNPPATPPARTSDGRFVTGPVPGSPAYLTEEVAVDAISEAAYLMSEHQRLFNEPLPDLRELISVKGRKARQVWEEKYKVPERRATLKAEQDKKLREGIAAEERAKIAKEYADKYGNENTRPLAPSRFPNYAKDATTGVPDKLAWTRPDKKERLRKRILEQVAKETGHPVQ